MQTLRILSLAALLAVPFAASAVGLGNYNALVFGDFNSSNTDTEGSLAVGGNFTSTNYTVGVKLPSTPFGSADAMVVGGNVNWAGSGSVNNGNLRYAGTGTFNDANNPTVNGGNRIHDASIASIFNPLKTQYTGLSTYLGGLAATGTTTVQHFSKWQFDLTGSDNNLNIFNVSAAKLSDCDAFNVNVPATSTVLINIVDDNGHSLALSNFGISLNNGLSKQHVVFNTSSITHITASSVGINGSLLAPKAYFDSQFSNLDGQLIANQFSGGYQINSFNFTGNLPAAPVPEPGTWAALGLGAAAMLRRRKK